ncbi:MAG TPA: DUF4255 domain-containing protein [Kofleriaceae bacterium]|nr:DUF4255 domain-containing protein [Kofleriaceae bacterium]
MGTFNAIREVSEILKRVLDAGLVNVGATCQVHDLVAQPALGMTLTLTLYEVAEDPSTRNRPDIRVNVGDKVELRRPPASLLLRYLITAWTGNILDDQQLLGRAIQTLYDEAIISGPLLEGTSLLAGDEAITATMIQQTIEDRTHVWRAYEKPYRLSVIYEVRVVKIDSERWRRTAQVRSRNNRHGVLEEAPT